MIIRIVILYVHTLLFFESASMDIPIWTDVRRACTSTTSANFVPSKTRHDADPSKLVSELLLLHRLNHADFYETNGPRSREEIAGLKKMIFLTKYTEKN